MKQHIYQAFNERNTENNVSHKATVKYFNTRSVWPQKRLQSG